MHQSQRGMFAGELYNRMIDNKDIVVITGDLGYGMFDKIQKDFPNQFINAGASEQLAVAMGIGMAMEGKIPFVYSITPFLLWRPAELIRNYLDHENIPVKLIGSGRNQDYEHDGFSHYAGDDNYFISLFPNIRPCWPETKEEIPGVVKWAIENEAPTYINLTR